MSETGQPRPEGLSPSRLDTVLLQLLRSRRTAALSTLNDAGDPAVSLTPFAVDPAQGRILIFVSGLAAHTRQLQRHPRAALLIQESEEGAERIHALSRAAIEVEAQIIPPDSADAEHAREVYFSRFPDARMLAELPDFIWVSLIPQSVRHIAGFGAARSINGLIFRELLISVA